MGDWAVRWLEVTALAMTGWCLADAWRRGPRYAAELLAGALFGLAAEQLAIWWGAAGGRPDAYRYHGLAWLITPDLPLVVVAAWGSLLYAGMKYSDGLGLPVWMRPAVDGLYALMLDLTMEVVAVHLGLWRWATPAEAQWFGVPYSNFGGWLLVALLFSAGARLVRPWARRLSVVSHGLLLVAVVGALTATLFSLLSRLFTGGQQDSWTAGLLALLAVAQLLGGLLWRRQASEAGLERSLADSPAPAGWVDPAFGLPLFWHGAYLGLAAVTGLFARHPAALFLTGAMAALGTLLTVGLLPVRGR